MSGPRDGDMDGIRNTILVGDVRTRLGDIPSDSVDTIITSPPYFKLRNYQHADQIGLEPSVDAWVDELRLVARGLSRVLKRGGSMWLNLGDTFSHHIRDGAPPKSLTMAPERLGLALITDGWTIRNKVIWAKPNPMPTSVRDRLSCTWEVVYFLTRDRDYWFDLDAIRIPHTSRRATRQPRRGGRALAPAWSVPPDWQGPLGGTNNGLNKLQASGIPGHPLGKNPGDVWTIPTAGYRGAHHAVYPLALLDRPIRATCPPTVCARCRTPWRRQPHTRSSLGDSTIGAMTSACDCRGQTHPGTVLDPFMGSGTTAIAAEQAGREWIGIELNPAFAATARQRIQAVRPSTAHRRAA